MDSGAGPPLPVQGFCSNFCRGLYFLFMLIFFGAGTAAFVLSSAPSQVFMGAVLFALGGCCGFVLVNWPSIVQSTRLCCCCIYSISVVFCACLLGAGCLLAERSPKYLRNDGLILLGLGLLGFLCVGLYALAARRNTRPDEGQMEEGARVSFLEQLSRTRINSNSAVELCKHLFADTLHRDKSFAPQRLQEADTTEMVVVCIVPGTSGTTVRYAKQGPQDGLPPEALVYVVPDKTDAPCSTK